MQQIHGCFGIRTMTFHLDNYKNRIMIKKIQTNYTSPDIRKLQEVVIDFRTKIYISLSADPEEAKKRYLLKNSIKVS